jgi:hypothetical protein
VKRKFRSYFALLGIILIGIGSWAIYSFFNQGASDLLAMIGINNFYIQTLCVIFFILIIFALAGTSIWKSVSRMIKG